MPCCTGDERVPAAAHPSGGSREARRFTIQGTNAGAAEARRETVPPAPTQSCNHDS